MPRLHPDRSSRKASDRIQQVNEAVIRSKELSIDVDCPMLINTQAGRQVDKYVVKIPGEGDAQWSSGIEQTVDKMFDCGGPGSLRTETVLA